MRVGYLSFDFREHPMGYLTRRLVSDHDRRVAGRIKSNGDAAAHFVFLQPDLGVAAFPAFSLRA